MKYFCVESVIIALMMAGLGLGSTPTLRAQNAPAQQPGVTSQSYSVVVESSVGPDGKRTQTKKVWKDGVLVEENTTEGDVTDDSLLEIDGQTSPGIVLRSEQNGTSPLGSIAPNASTDPMIQKMQSEFEAMRQQQEQMMQMFGFGNMLPMGSMNGAMPNAAMATPSAYWLGAQVAGLDEGTRFQLGLEAEEGIWIVKVVPDSPCAKAGLQPHDILLKLGDQAVSNAQQIGQILDKNGETPIKIEYIRRGQRAEGELTPAKRPEPVVAEQGALPMTQESSDQLPLSAPNEQIRVVRPGMILPAEPTQDSATETE